MLEGSKRDTIVAQESDEGSTPRATSDVEENHQGCADLLQGEKLKKRAAEYPSQNKVHPMKVLQKRKSLPIIKKEVYQDKVVKNVAESKVPQDSPLLKKVDTMVNLNDVNHLKVIPYGSGEIEGCTEFSDGKSLDSCLSPPDSLPSPSPSQCSFDAYSMTTSGFSETHSGQISTGELDVVDDLGSMDASGNGKSLDAWRSQSDPSGCTTNGHSSLLEHTIAEAELKVHRNSNSEPNLSGEKLKEEAVQLAMRVSSGNQTGSTTQQDSGEKDTDLSPDECYEFKTDRHSKPVQRAKSAPAPITPTAPRRQQIATAFALEKAQMKLSKLAAMEPIIEMPHAEPSMQTVVEKSLVEKKRSVSLEESYSTPPSVIKEDKKRLSVPGEPCKTQKSKHVSIHILHFVAVARQMYVT